MWARRTHAIVALLCSNKSILRMHAARTHKSITNPQKCTPYSYVYNMHTPKTPRVPNGRDSAVPSGYMFLFVPLIMYRTSLGTLCRWFRCMKSLVWSMMLSDGELLQRVKNSEQRFVGSVIFSRSNADANWAQRVPQFLGTQHNTTLNHHHYRHKHRKQQPKQQTPSPYQNTTIIHDRMLPPQSVTPQPSRRQLCHHLGHTRYIHTHKMLVCKSARARGVR